ncbi:hypothetical protein DB41_HX00040, partial [Neochlamydia sp. TUME1]
MLKKAWKYLFTFAKLKIESCHKNPSLYYKNQSFLFLIPLNGNFPNSIAAYQA